MFRGYLVIPLLVFLLMDYVSGHLTPCHTSFIPKIIRFVPPFGHCTFKSPWICHCEVIRKQNIPRYPKAPPPFAENQSRNGLWEAGSQTDRQTRQIHSYQIHCSCDLNVSLLTLWPSWSFLYALLHLWLLLQFSQKRTRHLSNWLFICSVNR